VLEGVWLSLAPIARPDDFGPGGAAAGVAALTSLREG